MVLLNNEMLVRIVFFESKMKLVEEVFGNIFCCNCGSFLFMVDRRNEL